MIEVWLCKWQTLKILGTVLVSARKLSVMRSFRLDGKFSCQNSVVHPKFSPDVSHIQPFRHLQREFCILADLDSGSNVGSWVWTPPSYTDTDTDIHTHMHTRTHAHTHAQTHTHMHRHTHAHRHIHTHTHAHIHKHTHTYTYTHTHTTHTHAHIHIHTRARNVRRFICSASENVSN